MQISKFSAKSSDIWKGLTNPYFVNETLFLPEFDELGYSYDILPINENKLFVVGHMRELFGYSATTLLCEKSVFNYNWYAFNKNVNTLARTGDLKKFIDFITPVRAKRLVSKQEDRESNRYGNMFVTNTGETSFKIASIVFSKKVDFQNTEIIVGNFKIKGLLAQITTVKPSIVLAKKFVILEKHGKDDWLNVASYNVSEVIRVIEQARFSATNLF